MDRVFLDANVLWSASYRTGSPLLRLWTLADSEMVTSTYALNEAMRNCADEDQAERLFALAAETSVHHFDTEGPGTLYLQTNISLPEKDWPILLTAIDRACTHLLTGDQQHFGALFGTVVEGVRIMRPGEYFREKTAQ